VFNNARGQTMTQSNAIGNPASAPTRAAIHNPVEIDSFVADAKHSDAEALPALSQLPSEKPDSTDAEHQVIDGIGQADLRRYLKDQNRRQNVKKINRRALMECQWVTRRLGISGQFAGNIFNGLVHAQCRLKGHEILVDLIDGNWELSSEVCPIADGAARNMGKNLISLVAEIKLLSSLGAARWLKTFIAALHCGEYSDQLGDIGLDSYPVGMCPAFVPWDAPDLPAQFGWLGEASTVVALKDRFGRLIGYEVRFSDLSRGPGLGFLGRPLILRLFYWLSQDGRGGWRATAPRRALPLFGLETLDKCPNGLVILAPNVAAAQSVMDSYRFADKAVVGLTCAIDAIGKTDFSLLAQREVGVLVNTGPAGRKQADQIKAALLEADLGIEVTDVEIVLRERKTPSLLGESLPGGASEDTLDGLGITEHLLRSSEGGPDVTLRFRETRSKAIGSTPVRRVGDFLLRPDGVYVERERDGKTRVVRICSPISVSRLARNSDGGDWGVCLIVEDLDKRQNAWCMPRSFLAGDPSAFCRILLGMGASISTAMQDKQDLARFLMHDHWTDQVGRALSVTQSGWHRDIFVFADGSVVGDSSERVVLQSSNPDSGNGYRPRGSFEDWQHLGKLCGGNSRLIFGMCVALTGPVLDLLGEENGGCHLRGPSSIGKTTIMRAAISVIGNHEQLMRNWRATANAIEAAAMQCSGTMLPMDELSQVSPDEAGQVVYMLGNGQVKGRATQTGEIRPSKRFKETFLSTGEISLQQHIESGGGKAMAGQAARMIDIPADAGAGLGIFEDLHGRAHGAELSLEIQQASSQAYGWPIRVWITHLADLAQRSKLLADLRTGIARFVNQYVPAGADGQVARVGRRIALYAAVGEACIDLSILPLKKGEAEWAALKCFQAWLRERGGVGSYETSEALTQVRRYLEVYGDSRFVEISTFDADEVDNPNRLTLMRSGFRKRGEDGHTEFYALPGAFGTDVCSGLNPRQVAKALKDAGHLIPGPNGKLQRTMRLPGLGTSKVYHLRSTLLSGSSDAANEELPSSVTPSVGGNSNG
jgi:putative DNA primase/helicase